MWTRKRKYHRLTAVHQHGEFPSSERVNRVSSFHGRRACMDVSCVHTCGPECGGEFDHMGDVHAEYERRLANRCIARRSAAIQRGPRKSSHTCPVEPRADNQLVHRICVHNLSQTGRIEISRARVDSNVAEVDVRPNCRETDLAEPVAVAHERTPSKDDKFCIPLFFDHFQKVSVIYYLFKYRGQGKPVMTTEGG